MNCDPGVAKHCLGSGRYHDDRRITAAVPDRDQLAGVLAVLDLDVRQRGHAPGAPVDDPLGAVDQSVVVEPLEDRLDGPGEPVVHGEPFAGPVHAVAEAAHLTEDLAAVLLFPPPDPGDELVAAEVLLAHTFGLEEMAFYQGLGADAGVVHAGQPERLESLHPAPPDQGVHQGVAECVADVQGPRDVRRRDHDAIRRLARRRVSGEVAALDPALVERPLYLCRRKRGRQGGGGWASGLGHAESLRITNGDGWRRTRSAPPGSRSGALLPAFALAWGDLTRHERGVDVLEHDLAVDHDPSDVVPAGHLVHDVKENLLHDRPQPAGAGAPQQRLVGDRVDGVVGELQLDVVDLEQPVVLLDQRVARLGEDPDQSVAVERADRGDDRQPADELRDQAELQQVLWHDLAEPVGAVAFGLAADLGAEAQAMSAYSVLDDLFQPGEGAAHDEQHVRRVDLDELLVRVLAPTLGRHRGGGALEDLQQRLLDALAGHVARDRRVVRLAGDLVDLVDVDDPRLGLLDVVIGGLDELEEDVLDVLADVARLGQRRGVGDGERDVEHLGEGLREQRLAAAGGAK